MREITCVYACMWSVYEMCFLDALSVSVCARGNTACAPCRHVCMHTLMRASAHQAVLETLGADTYKHIHAHVHIKPFSS